MVDESILETKVNELRDAFYYLSESTAKAANAAKKLEDVAAALQLLATQQSEQSATLKEIQLVTSDEARASNLAAMAEKVDKLAEATAWIARQNADGFENLKAIAAKTAELSTKTQSDAIQNQLAGLATTDQLARFQQKLETLTEHVGVSSRQTSEVAESLSKLEGTLGETTGALKKQLEEANSALVTRTLSDLNTRVTGLASTSTSNTLALTAKLDEVHKDLLQTQANYEQLRQAFQATMLALAEKLVSTTAPLAQNARVESIAKDVADTNAKTLSRLEHLEKLNDENRKVLALMGDALQSVMKSNLQTSSSFEKLAGTISELGKDTAAMRKQNEILTTALTTLVREVAGMEKEMESVERKMQNPEAAYDNMEKRFMQRLANAMPSK